MQKEEEKKDPKETEKEGKASETYNKKDKEEKDKNLDNNVIEIGDIDGEGGFRRWVDAGDMEFIS